MIKPDKGDYVTTKTKPRREGILRSIKKRKNDTVAVILQNDQSCYVCDIGLLDGYEE